MYDLSMQKFNSYIIRRPEDGSSAICPKCGIDRPLLHYYRHSERKDGAIRYRPYCKPCRAARPRQQKPKPVHSAIMASGRQTCRFCCENKPITEFYANGCFNDGSRKYRSRCKACVLSIAKEKSYIWYKSKAQKRSETPKNFLSGILNHAAKRKQHLGFDIDLVYIVRIYEAQNGKCAVSGVEMTYLAGSGRLQTNISIDRIDSSKGYLRGNVQLVCDVVNRMKQDMPEEALKWWCRRIIGDNDA
jgi:hypothetical protein